MLQRVASNAHSWWWASHIRTKQSKWLEQSLADMEDKVHATLQIIDHDGDSFAKRADMYYRKRPDIINFIEESFKAYRALAERYDHLSRELQSANRTVAQVFPERVQFALDEEDENSTSEHLQTPISKVPPKAIDKDLKAMSMMRRSGQGPLKRNTTCAGIVKVHCLGLTKAEALKEIDELHKRILGLQTEKEFVRGVYEHAADKYLEIENQITEMQEKVCSLQDEFGIGTVIEDSEARSLMATTALRSCQETLKKLQEKHVLTVEEAKADYTRIKESHYQLEALKVEFLTEYCDEQKESAEKSKATKNSDVRETTSPDLKEVIKQSVVASSSTNLSVIELAEKVDEIVKKVVKLETLVASQNTLVKRLTSETDELQGHIREAEGAKEKWIQSSEIMRKGIKELEEELCRVKSLNKTVEDQSCNLQTHFVEVGCNIAHLSEQLRNVKLGEDLEDAEVLFKEMKETLDDMAAKETKNSEEWQLAARDNPKLETTMEERKEDDVSGSRGSVITTESNQEKDLSKDWSDKGQERERTRQKDPSKDSSDKGQETDAKHDEDSEEEDITNWRQMYLNTLDDREKNLLEEYTSVLRNYKDVKRKLNHVERGNRESLYDLTTQVQELVKSNTMRDAEIQALRQQLNSHQTNREHPSFGSSPGYSFSSPERPSESRAKVDGFSCSTIPYVDAGRNEEYLIKAKEKDIKVSHIGECNSVSTIEGKIRTEIDQMLEENLEFWLRFSNSIQQKHKLQATIQDLEAELSRVQSKMKQEGSNKSKVQNSDAKPIYRHLREIHTELKLWMEQNAVLKDEVQSRLSCFCHIQDEISGASSGGRSVEDIEITENQAAKFQGEVLNMKQENKKIEEELETSLERMKALQVEVEKVLENLDEELGMSSPKGGPYMKQTPSRPRIPLRSFLFGVKLKKQKYKNSIFSYVNPSMQKPGGVGSPRPL